MEATMENEIDWNIVRIRKRDWIGETETKRKRRGISEIERISWRGE